MSITLIRTNSDGIVHGADNDKLTGCRKRLQTLSSTREGEMKDIVDLTCERCKEYFAKKMIRESNREESKNAKEEKKRYQRAKKQGIVSEATYEEYVLNRETEEASRRDSKKEADNYPPLKADAPGSSYPSYQNYNQPTAQPEMQANNNAPYGQQTVYQPQQPSYQPQQPAYQPQQPVYQPQQPESGPEPQFSSYQPSYSQYTGSNESNTAPESNKPAGSNDDFLAQFMIKPEPVQETSSSPVNSAVVYNDPLAAAKNTANSILSQLENDFGGPVTAGKADASSFYNSSSPLVDPVSSASTFESVTNEFGTFKAPETTPVKPVENEYSVPEVPQFNNMYSSPNSDPTDVLSPASDDTYSNYVNSFDSMNHSSGKSSLFDALGEAESLLNSMDVSPATEKTEPVNKSLDTIVPPVLDDIGSALAAAENSMKNLSAPSQPSINSFKSVVPPVQPVMDSFASAVPPVQPVTDSFASAVPPVQPVMDSFAPAVPPVQPVMDSFASAVPPVQPVMDSFASAVPPVQPVMDSFASAVPPVQPAVNSFASAVPPVQPAMNSFGSPVPPVQPPYQNGNNFAAQSTPVQPQYNPYMQNTQSQSQQFPSGNMPGQASSQFIMPQMAPKAAYQPKTQPVPQTNAQKTIPVLFNQAHSPTADSIEDALIALGAETAKKPEAAVNNDKEEIMPNFVAYVPSSSKVLHSAPPVNDYSSAPKRPMSAREAKKAAKIDAKFRKELLDRGFNPDEIKSQRRGK